MNKEFNERLFNKIAKTDSILIKAPVTISFPKLFFRKFYSKNSDKKFSSISTLSFDLDHYKDIDALEKLLELLDPFQIKANFACVGRLIEKYPYQHQKILDHGHEIINHTFSHPYNEELRSFKKFNDLKTKEQLYEIERCHEIIKNTLDYTTTGFRLPHFAVQYTREIYNILKDLGYNYSSSILAIKTDNISNPFLVNDIVEFPIITCPEHPFQAFDTYHAFRSKLTSHSQESFIENFNYLIEFALKNDLYLNFYFDPQDIMYLNKFELLLEKIIDSNISIKTYEELYSLLKN